MRVLPTSDEFNDGRLGPQWAWNHNPNDSAWSLLERKGHLRLTTSHIAADLPKARNTLTQRIFGPFSDAITELDVSRMQAGDMAGIAVLQLPHALFGVKAGEQSKFIIMENAGKTIDSIALGKRQVIFFKASVNTISNQAHFYYSFDNRSFIPIGDTLNMQFNLKMFTGNRVALFNYATRKPGGGVDFNWVRRDTRKGRPNLFKAFSLVQAEMYDEIYLAHVKASADTGLPGEQDIGHLTDGAWIRFNRVDFENGYKYLLLRVSPGQGHIDVYADKDSSHPCASVTLPATLSKAYTTIRVPVKQLTGTHQLTFKCTGNATPAASLNWFSFTNDPGK